MSAGLANRYRLKGTAGAVINQTFGIGPTPVVIGRAEGCQVRIDHESVSPRHAELRLEASGQVLLRDLGSPAGTRLNGQEITEAELGSGDEIQVGNARLMLQAPGLRPSRVLTEEAIKTRSAKWPWLLIPAAVALGALAWQQGWFASLAGILSP